MVAPFFLCSRFRIMLERQSYQKRLQMMISSFMFFYVHIIMINIYFITCLLSSPRSVPWKMALLFSFGLVFSWRCVDTLLIAHMPASNLSWFLRFCVDIAGRYCDEWELKTLLVVFFPILYKKVSKGKPTWGMALFWNLWLNQFFLVFWIPLQVKLNLTRRRSRRRRSIGSLLAHKWKLRKQ